MTMELDEKYPFPLKSLNLIMDLSKSGRLSKEEVEVLNEVVLGYLNLRSHILYGDDL